MKAVPAAFRAVTNQIEAKPFGEVLRRMFRLQGSGSKASPAESTEMMSAALNSLKIMVGAWRFELQTSCAQGKL